jgi:peptidyl-Asp metalloendopeptidase
MSFPASSLNDGDRRGLNWEQGGGWRDGTDSFPDWMQVDFSEQKLIDEINVFTIQDAYTSSSEPTETQTFSLYGITAFHVQYWDGSSWMTVPNGSVTGNNKVWRKFTFSEVRTSAIRVVINNALAGRSRVIEVEAWGPTFTQPPPPSQRLNAAAAVNGGVVTASSTTSQAEAPGMSFPASSLNDGDRRGLNWEQGGGWRDGTDSFPDWVQIDFAGARSISEVSVLTIQDAYSSPQEPVEDQTFSLYGVTAFDVEYWDGSRWAAVPGGSVTGSNKVWRKISFPTVTTDKVRVVIRHALAGRSRLIEIEAWTP